MDRDTELRPHTGCFSPFQGATELGHSRRGLDAGAINMDVTVAQLKTGRQKTPVVFMETWQLKGAIGRLPKQ